MVKSWSKKQELRPGKYALADYNYEDPRTKLLVEAETSVPIGGNDALEMYDYPGEFDKLGDPTASKLDFGDEWVRLRMEEEETRSITIRGAGTSPTLAPGVRFNLVNHVRESENDQYLITEVTHVVQQEIDSRPGRSVAGGIEYSNSFVCIPADRKFIPPPRSEKPVMRGPQTAVVVGESDSNPGEVRIDEKGRVKVQFHWDRSEDRNGETSCWIRVSQGWAGAGWGVQFHPRIGHEVIVSFLEGDPDRPIITGRVYNGVNEIPYPDPNQGGVKSRSTPDGSPDNFNEIRFDDTKDEEEFFVQAEKNHTIVVKNDESRTIGNDLGITVEKNRTEKIGENRKLSVGGEKTESVSGPKNISVTKDHTETIDGKMTVTVGKEKELTVAKKLTITAGEDFTISTDKNLSVSSTENSSFTVTGDHTLTVEKTSKTAVTEGYDVKAKEILIEADDKITIKVGSAKLIMESSGDITLEGAKIGIKGSGDVKIKGSKVAQN
jgi:type VI secretion system secreted protein VgrG